MEKQQFHPFNIQDGRYLYTVLMSPSFEHNLDSSLIFEEIC